SFAIKGKNEKDFLKEHTSCFGKNSVYDMLSKTNGKIILLGSKTSGYTFSHFIEEKAKVPYRYFKEFKGKIILENGTSKNIKINYYVRKLDINSDLDVYKQIKILKEDNNFKVVNFANSCIVSINANKYLQATLKALKKDVYCLL
ncbi:acetyltransferase, partial [Campylobacter jejuni]|nr:acetyltransferase [Campylobacter jejuni]